MKPQLGSLSELAAAYLQSMNVDAHPIFDAQVERLRMENDVAVAMFAIKTARRLDRTLTSVEHALVSRAEEYVKAGVQLPASFKPVSAYGRRSHQTLISLADSGNGHMTVTLKDRELLDGLIIHHEHIERSGSEGCLDPDLLPYRTVDIRQNGILRLHAADDAAVSVYCGRPNFQSPPERPDEHPESIFALAYRFDPLTPSYTAAASASAAFANTVADVKFNLDGLTCEQAIDFMRRVKAATDKRDDQFLSSQFNLNRVLFDDRPATVERYGSPQKIADPIAIANIAIELTCAANWERVTLDSSSRTVPSIPFTNLLDFPTLVRWVHEAHSKGLETYISGGMHAEHLRIATHAGVDGVGIGTWCHHREEGSGQLGNLHPMRIKDCLQLRNDAESSPRGIAAQLLAQLDAAHFANNAFSSSHARLRDDLFEELQSERDEKLHQLIEESAVLGFLTPDYAGSARKNVSAANT